MKLYRNLAYFNNKVFVENGDICRNIRILEKFTEIKQQLTQSTQNYILLRLSETLIPTS